MLQITLVGKNNLHFKTDFYFKKNFDVHMCLMSYISVCNKMYCFLKDQKMALNPRELN